MIRDFLLVGAGSFLGGGLRFLVSKGMTALVATAFPLGTFTVNVVGCLVLGFLSGLHFTGGLMSPSTRLLLTTGFCGGFTTFSTFMSESAALTGNGNSLLSAAYILASLTLGFAAVLVGQWLSKLV